LSIALLLVLLSAGVRDARGQRPPEAPRVTGAVELTIVNLDVIVTDKSGKPVPGLPQKDFEVLLDRKPVAITNFREVRGPAPAADGAPPSVAADAAAPADEPRLHRHIVLFFDKLQMIDATKRAVLFDSLKKLLVRELGPGDDAMIVTWNRSISTIVPFTGDLATLGRSLDDIAKKSSRIAEEGTTLDQVASESAWFASLNEPPPPGTRGPTVGPGGAGSPHENRSAAAQAYGDMKGKASALKGLVATLGGMDGRKILVFASHRFGRYAGLEFFLDKRAKPGDSASPDAREFDAKSLIEAVTETANAQGVTIYALFPVGWETVTSSAADSAAYNPATSNAPTLGGREQIVESNEMEALLLVSGRTGGVAMSGTGEVREFADRVATDLSSYYSIGYAPPEGPAKRSAAVAVKLKNRDLTVRVRSAVVARTAAERMMDRVLSNLFSADKASRLPVKAVAKTPAPAPDGSWRIPLEVQIPIKPLALLPNAQGASGSFSVFVASVGPKGNFNEITNPPKNFDIATADLERAKSAHFTYEVDVPASSPEARISVGVLDEVGKDAGFAIVTLPAPPKK
jgi:VWFA-related protein